MADFHPSRITYQRFLRQLVETYPQDRISLFDSLEELCPLEKLIGSDSGTLL